MHLLRTNAAYHLRIVETLFQRIRFIERINCISRYRISLSLIEKPENTRMSKYRKKRVIFTFSLSVSGKKFIKLAFAFMQKWLRLP